MKRKTAKSAGIDRWIRHNTFHHSEFSDIRTLTRLKEKLGISISLCLPTLNEEKTIGKEVVIFKSELMTRWPLIDELAVIDSGSTDHTREIAASYGADVYLSSEILPGTGHQRGKGENLWKAIYQLRGDIIVYVDADIKNIRPHFASGLIGPLLKKPEIKYVKAFYDRPLAIGKGIRTSGGGRVTEILVRPLFSIFFPELTGIIQPLSGEYAVRREILEQIPFPVGYGVETANLIDVYTRWGMQVFGQTDLDQRVHRHQSTESLGKMSFGILQTFFSRLPQMESHYKEMGPERALRQFLMRDGKYEQQAYRLVEEERPPMLNIPAYIRKRGR